MSILLTNLCIVYMGALGARFNPYNGNKLQCNYKKYNYFFIFIVLVSLIFVSGFRYYSGTDFGTYRGIYNNTPDINLKEESEWGFLIINKLLYGISTNSQIMFLVMSIITNILIVYAIIKYSSRLELSMYLYITTFCYYSTFNGIRQWVASAILFVGFKYIIDRNFIKYLICIMVAYTFHNSSLVMIPMYFIVNRKFLSKGTLIIVTIFILCYIFYNGFLDTLFTFLQGTKYEHYKEGMEAWQEGAGMIRVLVYTVPLVVTVFLRKYMNGKNYKELDILLNLCVMSVLFMLLGTRHVFFARLNIMTDIYYVLLLPKLTELNDKNMSRFMYFSIVIFYFAFSYALLIGKDANIIPYQMNINLF